MTKAYVYCISGEVGAKDSWSILADLSLYRFDESVLPLAHADLKVVAELVQTAPNEVLDVARALQEGNAPRALQLASEIGLTEEAFTARGGGWPGLLVVVLVALVVLAPRKLDDPDPHRPPPKATSTIPGIPPPTLPAPGGAPPAPSSWWSRLKALAKKLGL